MRCKRLIAEAHRGSPNIFFTLTMRASDERSPDLQAVKMVEAWRSLRRWLMKDLGLKKLPFMAVFERHKSGYPHLHIAIRSQFLPIGKIVEFMDGKYDSPIQYIEVIDNPAKVGGYVVKYMSKCPERYKFSKRYWKSRDYELDQKWKDKPVKPPGHWAEVFSNNVYAVVGMYEQRGWRFIRSKGHVFTAYHDELRSGELRSASRNSSSTNDAKKDGSLNAGPS